MLGALKYNYNGIVDLWRVNGELENAARGKNH